MQSCTKCKHGYLIGYIYYYMMDILYDENTGEDVPITYLSLHKEWVQYDRIHADNINTQCMHGSEWYVPHVMVHWRWKILGGSIDVLAVSNLAWKGDEYCKWMHKQKCNVC